MELLRGTVIDGRAENIRYRQNQLHQLHHTLRINICKVCDAIAADASSANATAETEFFLAMDSISKAYEELNFDQSLKEEYLLKEGKDNPTRRVGVGLVAIRPGIHSRFYSIVTPLAMAIAAGNCVLLELENLDSSIDQLLKDILPTSLDKASFAILTRKLTPAEILETNLFLGQDDSALETGKMREISQTRSLAVVDRSANLQHAAKEITNAKLSPSNGSPYSPDLVIVNDFICEEFIEACLGWSGVDRSEKWSPGLKDGGLWEAVCRAERTRQIKITKSATSYLNVVEIKDRSCPLVTMKISGPYLVVLSSTGIVDTVTMQRFLPEKAATYIFASPSTAKVISENLPSAASYINQIPQQLLIGPVSYPHSLHPRYTTQMFSTSRPQFISPAPHLPKSNLNLRDIAAEPLKPTGQRPGHALGFFEQGILIGFGFTSFVVLPLAGWLMWAVGKKGLSFLR